MANCVLRAFIDHLNYLSVPFRSITDSTYWGLKSIGQFDPMKPTSGVIVPWIIWGLVELNGFCWDTGVSTQHSIISLECYRCDVDELWTSQAEILKWSIASNLFGPEVECITLAPAIYCDIDAQHAFFAERVPRGNITLAIQLRVKEE